jgi:hypothetical protein
MFIRCPPDQKNSPNRNVPKMQRWTSPCSSLISPSLLLRSVTNRVANSNPPPPILERQRNALSREAADQEPAGTVSAMVESAEPRTILTVRWKSLA